MTKGKGASDSCRTEDAAIAGEQPTAQTMDKIVVGEVVLARRWQTRSVGEAHVMILFALFLSKLEFAGLLGAVVFAAIAGYFLSTVIDVVDRIEWQDGRIVCKQERVVVLDIPIVFLNNVQICNFFSSSLVAVRLRFNDGNESVSVLLNPCSKEDALGVVSRLAAYWAMNAPQHPSSTDARFRLHSHLRFRILLYSIPFFLLASISLLYFGISWEHVGSVAIIYSSIGTCLMLFWRPYEHVPVDQILSAPSDTEGSDWEVAVRKALQEKSETQTPYRTLNG